MDVWLSPAIGHNWCILQSMQYSKVLIRSAEKDKLHAVNKEECRVLIGRWQSQECMNAIISFFTQKSSKL